MAESSWQRIRLDVPEGAVKAVVLGTALPTSDTPVPDRLGLPRQPAALCLLAPAEHKVYLIDVAEPVLEQLGAATFRDQFGLDAVPSVDGILLTHVDRATRLGLARLTAGLTAGQTIPLYGTGAMLAAVGSDPVLAEMALLERLEFRPVGPGQVLDLSASVRVTTVEAPIEFGRSFLGYRIEGARRSLLYLPRCGPYRALQPPLRDLLVTGCVALLDGTRLERDTPNPDGLPDSAHPPISEALDLLDSLRVERLHLRFTHLAAGNPILDPTNRYQKLLRDRGGDLLRDGSEYWL